MHILILMFRVIPWVGSGGSRMPQISAPDEAKIIIEQWRVRYNTKRPHSSLFYMPPAPEAKLPYWNNQLVLNQGFTNLQAGS